MFIHTCYATVAGVQLVPLPVRHAPHHYPGPHEPKPRITSENYHVIAGEGLSRSATDRGTTVRNSNCVVYLRGGTGDDTWKEEEEEVWTPVRHRGKKKGTDR